MSADVLERIDLDELWADRDAAVARLVKLGLGDCTHTAVNEAHGLLRSIRRIETHLRDANQPPPPGGWALPEGDVR